MPKILEELRQEHINISRLLNTLENKVKIIEGGGSVASQLMTDILEYIVNYPDLYHHPKEDLIFELLRHKNHDIGKTIDRLIHEHKELTDMAIVLSKTLARSKDGDDTECERVISECNAYIKLNREHMQIEEREIFPHAEMELSEDDWTQIEAGFTCEEDPLFGKIIRKQYQDIYDSIV